MSIAVMSLLLNILIGGLLMANICYCWVLNKRIKILQDGKSELANLLQYFDEATERASESIVALQSASKKIGESMQGKIDKANFLMEDLAFMVENGNRLADQLDANFAVKQARKRVLPDGGDYDREDDFVQERIVVKPEYAAEEKPPPRIVQMNSNSNKEKTAASLEEVLGRMVGRFKPADAVGNDEQSVSNAASQKEVATRAKTPSKSRSKAEQELLEMIRGGIKG